MPCPILVTGGSNRLGAGTVLHLAKHGYNTILLYNSNTQNAHDISELVTQKFNVSCHILQADLNDSMTWDCIAEECFSHHKCKVLINNAAIFQQCRIHHLTNESLETHFRINLFAPIMLSKALLNIHNNPLIINIIDDAIKRKTMTYFPYLLSKKSLHDFTVALQEEYKERQAIIHAIYPPKILEDRKQYSISELLHSPAIISYMNNILQILSHAKKQISIG